MWTRGWRDEIWSRLSHEPWDLVVIGGGITGAGILAEASKLGVRALLVEGSDFASGTSSRSTKLVHGGLRYLRNAQIRLTRESVREREHLLKEAEGLVMPLGFYIASFQGDKMPPWMFGAGLAIYDVLARKWNHKRLRAADVLDKLPPLRGAKLKAGFHYFDAQTDDARLVVRVLREAVRRGGTALNYARVEGLLRDRSGRVQGVALRDSSGVGAARSIELKARAVVSATGAWADDVRSKIGAERKMRAIRGSHFVFPASRLPLGEAISMLHPRDERVVFAIPWEGVTLFGTTDVDHAVGLDAEPSISQAETEYLLEAARHAFPNLDLSLDDVRSTYAGVRGVVNTGTKDPSKESREHVLWREEGLLTVTGGKLTTFRLMALEALRALGDDLAGSSPPSRRGPILNGKSERAELAALPARLVGRHGAEAAEVARACADALSPIGDTPAIWGELAFAARAEGVVHLDDLLLRRVRLGLIADKAGLPLMDRIRKVAQPELGWDDARWTEETTRYESVWQRSYAPSPSR